MQIYTQKGKAYDEFYSAEVPLPSQSTKQLSNGAPKQPEYPAHIRFRDCAEGLSLSEARSPSLPASLLWTITENAEVTQSLDLLETIKQGQLTF